MGPPVSPGLLPSLQSSYPTLVGLIGIYIYPVHCAHDPPPCHFITLKPWVGWKFSFLGSHCCTKFVGCTAVICKSILRGFEKYFLDFWGSGAWLLVICGGPGRPCGQFFDFLNCPNFGDVSGTKKSVHLTLNRHHWRHFGCIVCCCCCCFFGYPIF